MKPKFKVVFDTNIYISAVIFGGNPRTCLELARSGEIDLYCSREVLFELTQKLKSKFGWDDEEVIDLLQGVAKFSKVVKPSLLINKIKNDPSDNRILECALEAKANLIISGDIKHILVLKEFKGIKILGAKDFLDLYYRSL